MTGGEIRMRIKTYIVLSLLITASLVGYVFSSITNYKSIIGVNLPRNSTVLKEEDDSGGFPADGEYYAVVQLTKDGIQKFVKNANKTGKWLALPLSRDISNIIDLGEETHNIPKNIKHGIYYVRDRYAEYYPNDKNTNINCRGTYNVTIAILDTKTGKLYIYKLDT
jgi:hypothetical protein